MTFFFLASLLTVGAFAFFGGVCGLVFLFGAFGLVFLFFLDCSSARAFFSGVSVRIAVW